MSLWIFTEGKKSICKYLSLEPNSTLHVKQRIRCMFLLYTQFARSTIQENTVLSFTKSCSQFHKSHVIN